MVTTVGFPVSVGVPENGSRLGGPPTGTLSRLPAPLNAGDLRAGDDGIADRSGIELDRRVGLVGRDGRHLVAALRVEIDEPVGRRRRSVLLRQRADVVVDCLLLPEPVDDGHGIADIELGVHRSDVLRHLLEI
jgi:hypothetical protein